MKVKVSLNDDERCEETQERGNNAAPGPRKSDSHRFLSARGPIFAQTHRGPHGNRSARLNRKKEQRVTIARNK
jgi:hypothetical protein